mgnify:CR=1 FL=1
MLHSKWVEKTISEMEKNPSRIQNFDLKRSVKEKYLGMWFVQNSYENLINENVKAKKGLMMAAAVSIRTLCDLPQIRRFGKIQAQKLMAMADISNSSIWDSCMDIDH